MDKLIDYLVKQINSKGVLGVTPLISIFILALIFISPAYLFILFYKREMYINYSVTINIVTVMILDMLLYLVLFFIGALRDIEVEIDEKYYPKFHDEGVLIKDVIMTIVLMGVVSIVIILSNSLYIINGDSANLSNGIINLGIILGLIWLGYILGIVVKTIIGIWKRGNENSVNILLIITAIIIGCLILAAEIIGLIFKSIWDVIFIGINIKG